MHLARFKYLWILVYGSLVDLTVGLSPVILIPGDGGNQLEAKLNKTSSPHYICAKSSSGYFTAWLNLELLVPFVMDCWVDYMRLEYDNVTRTTRSPPGVEVRVPGWGQAEPVEWLDPSHSSAGAYFSSIAAALVTNGYRRNFTLFGAPYDFRKAPNENGQFFIALRALVEASYAANNKTRVTLLGHSMGGVMAATFLRRMEQRWKDVYIRRLVSMSAPWAGAVKAVKVYAIGDDLGSLVLRAATLRSEQVTCPSLAWLLPSPALWPADEVLVQTLHRNYTAATLGQYLKDLGLPDAAHMLQDLGKYSDLSSPGVETHCLYGYNISTVERLEYSKGAWLDGSPRLVMGDGDGTVNARSLRLCERWAAHGRHVDGTQAAHKVYVLPLPAADHLKVLHDARAIAYITSVLSQP